ncbi:YggS family pyridoxal phosphate-dependent enzyme [Namhaeicola litoreus]|uniref:Pyridoxal phosphate homeostasis protein n=1 Tax=Namhaeicola litoreus TaxID=1052145 RepID=A0ABW3Y6A4_9FLAO
MFIKEKIKLLKTNIPAGVTLVAVSKTKPIADIQEAFDAGQKVFGENKVQEMVQKFEELPKDIQWHMIGHVQKNKIKYMASFVALIHGVDHWSTLLEIDKQAKKHNRVINCLLQAKIAKEETKFGMSFKDIEALLHSEELPNLHHVKICGLMGMASFVEDENTIREEFKRLKNLFDKLKSDKTFAGNIDMKFLSMGMSGDYPIAIEEGSNMIRVGSAIFGERNYIAN